MKYRPEWKGRLRITWNKGDEVWWDGNKIGLVWSKHQKGACSPRGMQTDCVWFCQEDQYGQLPDPSKQMGPYQSKDIAISYLIETAEQLVTP